MRWLAASPLLFVLLASCLSVQDFGGGADGGAEADGGPVLPSGGGPLRWEWANPAPTGKALYGIGGTSEKDVWVAGEGGTVAHFDGAGWDLRHAGPEGTRYFAVGTRAAGDVWVAGDTGGKIGVVHFDGSSWVDSYPFAGSAFGTFSHGPGPRLFAVADWDILELGADGTWTRTDTSENGVFGPPADVWVSESGDAWTITTGAKLLRLPAGTQRWKLQPPLGGVPSGAVGLGIAGAGAKVCAFYTGRTSGAGFLLYDGGWHVGPASTDPLAVETGAHGARAACLADGRGLLANGGTLVYASATTAPEVHTPYDFPGESTLGLFSLDGARAFAVGALGGFIALKSGDAMSWHEAGTTVRKDMLAVDVGPDGAVMAIDALQPDRSSGGEVLSWREAWGLTKGPGFSGPSIPVGVAVVGAADAWVAANDNSRAGVAHFTGSWGVTRFLDGGPSFATEALAIWAPAKDDVWVTGRERCPDQNPLPNAPCSKPVRPFVWHYAGGTWNALAAAAVYRSVHGTGPDDVWLAGDAVAHWDGQALTPVASLQGPFGGVWSSASSRVWLWGDKSVLFDGTNAVPLGTALNVAADWTVAGIAESTAGDVFVLTKRATGTSLLWFDPTRTRLVEQLESDLELWAIRGRGDQLWAVGAGGASLRFAPAPVR